ncbi:MAG: hypothetical protein K0S76_1077 [Herbinix sp.]|jgi:hypothetical protein|nr:hypothetical protein [Herbinix sp.]
MRFVANAFSIVGNTYEQRQVAKSSFVDKIINTLLLTEV